METPATNVENTNEIKRIIYEFTECLTSGDYLSWESAQNLIHDQLGSKPNDEEIQEILKEIGLRKQSDGIFFKKA